MIKKMGYLGEGSYGTVHRATDRYGNSFAVKSSPLDKCFSLHKEQRIYANFVNCPEIVHCFCGYRSTEEGKLIYNLVLDYAHEGSLRNHMNGYPGRRLPEFEVRDFTRMILRGLSLVHRSGYVHCDLKPDNILVFIELEWNLRVVTQLKLADFGLAKEPNSRENPRPGFRGTPQYMSPESVLFGQLGPELDIWSLGCIVIEMVIGRPVYGAIKDINELRRKIVILNGTPKIRENLSELGKDFLKRWTNKNVHNISKELRKLHLEGINNATNSVAVVAVLFATVAFAAIFTVPGGDDNNGMAVVVGGPSFKIFFIFNAIALFTSLAVVVVQITLVRGETKAERRVVEVINKLMWLASVCTSVAFMASSYIVVGRKHYWAAILVTVVGGVIMACVLGTMTYYVVRSKRNRSIRKRVK